MPAQVPQASFQPISPLLDLDKLVDETKNFEYVTRISYDAIEAQGADALDKLVLLHVVLGGKPLVIEGLQHRLPRHLFSHAWLDAHWGKRVESPRDLGRRQDLPMTVGNYLRNMSKLTEQWHSGRKAYLNPDAQRLYLKDIDCPDAWSAYLRNLLPPSLFYLNESTGDVDGPGALDEETTTYECKTRKRGVAPAGDLMSSLPGPMRAENLMCYIGHEGTYTPAHREMCASLGHNLMVETSADGLDRWGRLERPGSSIWFMTETKDRHLVSEYWLSILGHDIEVESHFAQINAWKMASFKTYVVEQRFGDFVLIPPLAPHQVWNRGTRTMKVAWNRTTVETLEMALKEALPRARMVCRDEQYKNKAIVFYSMIKYAALLSRIHGANDNTWSPSARAVVHRSRKIGQLRRDFRRLFQLFSDVLLSEMFDANRPREKTMEFVAFDSNITCSFCRCNIFNRFLTCKSCIIREDGAEDDTYDVCMDCYAMGRSCVCISGLTWVEQFQWSELVGRHDDWRRLIIALDGGVNEASPVSLAEMQRQLGKKTLAHICQEQVKMRPWRDHTKPLALEESSEDEDEAGEEVPARLDGSARKRKRRSGKKSAAWKKRHANCHTCKHQEELWKMARCACGRSYCYGVLFRAFDMMPQQVMENAKWKCPRCLGICSCGACRKVPGMRPYDPSGTMVGHDTRQVADPRSVESLVDFSRSNLTWIERQPAAASARPYETVRLRRFREQAEREKARDETLVAAYAEEEIEDELDLSFRKTVDEVNDGVDGELAIDPMLQTSVQTVTKHQNRLEQSHTGSLWVPINNDSRPSKLTGTPRSDVRRTADGRVGVLASEASAGFKATKAEGRGGKKAGGLPTAPKECGSGRQSSDNHPAKVGVRADGAVKGGKKGTVIVLAPERAFTVRQLDRPEE